MLIYLAAIDCHSTWSSVSSFLVNKDLKTICHLSIRILNMGNSEVGSSTEIEHEIFQKGDRSLKGKVTFIYPLTKTISDWTEDLAYLIKRNLTKNLILPQLVEIQVENMCRTVKCLQLVFDLYPYTLKDEIEKRIIYSKVFTEQELWYILYRLLEASAPLGQRRRKVGDIRPVNVLLDQMGNVALLSCVSFPDQETNYFKSLHNREPTFLAPEELADLESGQQICRANPTMAESFSIGLTILDAAMSKNSEELYDMTQVKFNVFEFNQNILKFKDTLYSAFFQKTVLNLLEAKACNRVSPGESLAVLLPYEKAITSLQQFTPDRNKSREALDNYHRSMR